MRPAGALAVLATALGPPAALLGVAPLAARGAEGTFQGGLAALVVAPFVGGLLVRGLRGVLALAAAALLAGGAHLLARGPPEGAPALALLLAAVGFAASGLAAAGRRIGAGALGAGAVAAAVLWVAMAGLFWADPVAAAAPPPRRHALKQAILHVDPATAAAYGVASFDRLHEPRVYAEVPLATSLVEPPRPAPTALSWAAVGAAAWGAAVARRRRAAPAAGTPP